MSEQSQTVVLIPASLDEVIAALRAGSAKHSAGDAIEIDELDVGDQRAVRLSAAGSDTSWVGQLASLAASRTVFVHTFNTGGVDAVAVFARGRRLYADGAMNDATRAFHSEGDDEHGPATRSMDWMPTGEMRPSDAREPWSPPKPELEDGDISF